MTTTQPDSMTKDEGLAPSELARQMLAHLDQCNEIGKFSSIEELHIRQLCEALVKPTPVEPGALRPDRDVIAYSIIEGSAGIRAAEHAKDFQTANWTDALQSADAVIAALSQPSSSESGGWLPVSSAPKDQYILLCGYLDGPHDPRIKMGYWWSEEGCWKIDGASWKPVFWMPLPSTPSSKER